jgi:hypothetical protein
MKFSPAFLLGLLGPKFCLGTYCAEAPGLRKDTSNADLPTTGIPKPKLLLRERKKKGIGK